jgi:hypothetical protein
MGNGRWSNDVYAAASAYRAARGQSAFDYTDRVMRSRPRRAWTVHPSLDPHGITVRESRDSAEHPKSLAVAVLLDVTGSMAAVPRALQQKLPDLLGLIRDRGYATDPQIMFGAIGDATCDRVPLQIGQFESDNRMDDDLGRLVLEGGGGGQMHESYELALYFMARHTSIDCHEKRGKRGYLFIVGDEMSYPQVDVRLAQQIVGADLREGIAVEAIAREVQQKYDTYYVLPEGTAYAGSEQVLSSWHRLLGQNVLELDDLDAVCETIALTIGLGEDAVDLDTGLAHLAEVGSRTARGSVARALRQVAA